MTKTNMKLPTTARTQFSAAIARAKQALEPPMNDAEIAALLSTSTIQAPGAATFANWRRGENVPKAEMVGLLCRAFGEAFTAEVQAIDGLNISLPPGRSRSGGFLSNPAPSRRTPEQGNGVIPRTEAALLALAGEPPAQEEDPGPRRVCSFALYDFDDGGLQVMMDPADLASMMEFMGVAS